MKNSSEENGKMARNKFFMCFGDIKKLINHRVPSDGAFLSPSRDIIIDDNLFLRLVIILLQLCL